MNIYALEGHKVICSTFQAGHDWDKEQAKRFLELGEEYTIKRTSVSSSRTEVELKEFPNESFNSVFFEDVKTQSKAKDKQHLHYKYYN